MEVFAGTGTESGNFVQRIVYNNKRMWIDKSTLPPKHRTELRTPEVLNDPRLVRAVRRVNRVLEKYYPEEMKALSEAEFEDTKGETVKINEEWWIRTWANICEVHRQSPAAAIKHINGIALWLERRILPELKRINSNYRGRTSVTLPEQYGSLFYNVVSFDESGKITNSFENLPELLMLADYMQSKYEREMITEKSGLVAGKQAWNEGKKIFRIILFNTWFEEKRPLLRKRDGAIGLTYRKLEERYERNNWELWRLGGDFMDLSFRLQGVTSLDAMLQGSAMAGPAERILGLRNVLKTYPRAYGDLHTAVKEEMKSVLDLLYIFTVTQEISADELRGLIPIFNSSDPTSLAPALDRIFGKYEDMDNEKLAKTMQGMRMPGWIRSLPLAKTDLGKETISFALRNEGDTVVQLLKLGRILDAARGLGLIDGMRDLRAGKITESELREGLKKKLKSVERMAEAQKANGQEPDLFTVLYYAKVKQTIPLRINEGPNKGLYQSVAYLDDFKTPMAYELHKDAKGKEKVMAYVIEVDPRHGPIVKIFHGKSRVAGETWRGTFDAEAWLNIDGKAWDKGVRPIKNAEIYEKSGTPFATDRQTEIGLPDLPKPPA